MQDDTKFIGCFVRDALRNVDFILTSIILGGTPLPLDYRKTVTK